MPIIKEIKQHKVLLDTHVWIWLAEGNPILSQAARKAIDHARDREHLFLSPISAWEIAMLAERKRVALEMDVADWVQQWVDLPGIQIAELSCQTAVLSNRLPGVIHGDPADRILIASAFELKAVFVTADEKILKFSEGAFISAYNPTSKRAISE